MSHLGRERPIAEERPLHQRGRQVNVAEAVSGRPCSEKELAQAMLTTASNRRGVMAYVVIERAG